MKGPRLEPNHPDDLRAGCMYRVVLQSGNVVVAWFLGLEAQSGQLWLAFQDEEEDVEEWVPWAAVARCRLLSTGDQE